MVEWIIHSSGVKMKTMPLVKADAFIVNVGTPEQRQDLLKQAVLRQRTTPSISNTNEGCWRGQFKYTNDEWLLNELKQHLKTVVDYYIDADPSYRHRLTPRGLDIKLDTSCAETILPITFGIVFLFLTQK